MKSSLIPTCIACAGIFTAVADEIPELAGIPIDLQQQILAGSDFFLQNEGTEMLELALADNDPPEDTPPAIQTIVQDLLAPPNPGLTEVPLNQANFQIREHFERFANE